MKIIDESFEPQESVYYIGALLYNIILNYDGRLAVNSLYKFSKEKITFQFEYELFLYSLNYLYLLNKIYIKKGEIIVC